MSELLPCPFCGGEANLNSDYISERDEKRWEVWHECSGHKGESAGYGYGYHPWFETPWYKTEAEAIAAWNTRASYEADSYFFLPKPKESLYSLSEPTYFVDGHNVKATCSVSIMEDSVKRWKRQIEESMSRDVVGRICEVFGNTRAERTCRNVNINGYSLRFECSACGFASITTNCETRMDEMPKHCPNCGRKVVDE